MLAIPVFIIATLFLGWLLVRLTLNALALFAAIFVASIAHGAGAGWLAAIGFGTLCGVGVAAFGQNAARYMQRSNARFVLGLAFAIPAGAAAWSAVRGISGLVSGETLLGTISSAVAAVVIGTLAWQKAATGPDHQPA